MHDLAEPTSPLIDISLGEAEAIAAGAPTAGIVAAHAGLVEPVEG
jgi:hypothetical protein